MHKLITIRKHEILNNTIKVHLFRTTRLAHNGTNNNFFNKWIHDHMSKQWKTDVHTSQMISFGMEKWKKKKKKKKRVAKPQSISETCEEEVSIRVGHQFYHVDVWAFLNTCLSGRVHVLECQEGMNWWIQCHDTCYEEKTLFKNLARFIEQNSSIL